VFNGSIMPDITEGQADFLVKVESRSRKGKEDAVLTLVVTQGGTALGKSVSDSRAEKVKDYLRGLGPDVAAESLELDIKAQEEAIVKAERKLESLKKDQADLERKLEANKQSQRDTENEISAKKEGLELLKSRRVIPAVPNAGQ
jgi:predicted RNase H-like nuclease (RuvC/YqgF family)